MASTLNMDLNVTTGSLSSSLQQINQALSSAASGGMGSFGGGGGGGGQFANTRQGYGMPQGGMMDFANSGAIPFQAMTSMTNSAIQQTMAGVHQIGSQTMMAGASGALWQPPISYPKASVWGANAINTGISFGLAGAFQGISNKVIGSRIGGAFVTGASGAKKFGTVGSIVSAVATFALASGVIKATGTDRYVKQVMYSRDGQPYEEPGSAGATKNMFYKLHQQKFGGQAAAIMGFNPGMMENIKAWNNLSAQVVRPFKDVARGRGMHPGDMGPDLMLAEAMGDTYMRDARRKAAPYFNRVTGKMAPEGMEILKQGLTKAANSPNARRIEYLSKQGISAEDQLGRHMQNISSMLGQVEGPSPWTLLGWKTGGKHWLGKKRGVEEVIHYAKGQSQTTLGLDPKIKEMLGGSLQIADRYVDAMISSTSVGGAGFGVAALTTAGIKPDTNVLNIAGQFSSQFGGSLSNGINLLGGWHRAQRGMSKGSLTTAGRTAALQQVELARKLTGVGNDVTNRDLFVMMNGGGDAAEAQAAMIFGEGAKITYKGRNMVALGEGYKTYINLQLQKQIGSKPGQISQQIYDGLAQGGFGNISAFSSDFKQQIDKSGLTKLALRVSKGDTAGINEHIVRSLKKQMGDKGFAGWSTTKSDLAIQGAIETALSVGIRPESLVASGKILNQLGIKNTSDLTRLKDYYESSEYGKNLKAGDLATISTKSVGEIRGVLDSSDSKEAIMGMSSSGVKITGSSNVIADQAGQLASLLQQCVTILKNNVQSTKKYQ